MVKFYLFIKLKLVNNFTFTTTDIFISIFDHNYLKINVWSKLHVWKENLGYSGCLIIIINSKNE